MVIEGNILKMKTELSDPVKYHLPFGDREIDMNNLIGNKISMHFTGQINCIACGKITKSSFGQGFCYKCMQTAPEASESVIRPELSKAHFEISRDKEWAEKHDLIDHFVYLAVSTETKVGVTRCHQIPSRWIDQGANMAIKIAKTPNRHIAGIIEVFLKQYFTDRTNWQSMLKNTGNINIDLLQEKQKALNLLPAELQKYSCTNNNITRINYPITNPPQKIKSLSFDKTNQFNEVLHGIKGQYLIFKNGTVLNIRKHNGYYIKFSY